MHSVQSREIEMLSAVNSQKWEISYETNRIFAVSAMVYINSTLSDIRLIEGRSILLLYGFNIFSTNNINWLTSTTRWVTSVEYAVAVRIARGFWKLLGIFQLLLKVYWKTKLVT